MLLKNSCSALGWQYFMLLDFYTHIFVQTIPEKTFSDRRTYCPSVNTSICICPHTLQWEHPAPAPLGNSRPAVHQQLSSGGPVNWRPCPSSRSDKPKSGEWALLNAQRQLGTSSAVELGPAHELSWAGSPELELAGVLLWCYSHSCSVVTEILAKLHMRLWKRSRKMQLTATNSDQLLPVCRAGR